MKTSSRNGSISTLAGDDEVGLLRVRQEEQPLEDVLDPLELVQRDADLRAAPFVRCSTSRWPRAIVTGVRSSCETSCRSASAEPSRTPAGRPVSSVRTASWRRRACQTIARNIVAINGTSKSSIQPASPLKASLRMRLPVARMTRPSTIPVGFGSHTRKPYSSVRLIQMKWNGIVSQLGTSAIATRFAAANANHATSTPLRRRKPIAAMPHRLDGRVRAQLLA